MPLGWWLGSSSSHCSPSHEGGLFCVQRGGGNEGEGGQKSSCNRTMHISGKMTSKNLNFYSRLLKVGTLPALIQAMSKRAIEICEQTPLIKYAIYVNPKVWERIK